MTNEKLYEVLGDINEKHINEARAYRKAKRPSWMKWGAMAALPCRYSSYSSLRFAKLLEPARYYRCHRNNPNGVIVDNPTDNPDDDTTPVTSEIHISMDNISFNEVGALTDASRIWGDPELYDHIQWDKNASD